jgi:hypothetical protein
MADLKLLNRNFASDDCLKKRDYSIKLVPNAGSLTDYHTTFLFDYDIFPATIMSSKAQWQLEARQMQLGDVILQKLYIPPLGWGLCIECAVRVCALENEPGKVGFAYETLPGHVEKGVSDFHICEQDGDILFGVHTRSAPAHWLARAARPIARCYQSSCTRQALLHVKRRFEEENG